MVAEEGVAVHFGFADGAGLGLAAQLDGLFLNFLFGSFFRGGFLGRGSGFIHDELFLFLGLTGGALLGGHVGFQLFDGLFDLGHGVDIFINQGLVLLARFMQAVDQRAQLALCLGQTCLLVQQLQLVLALICDILSGLFGGVKQLHALLFQHINIEFKHKVTPLSLSLRGSAPRAL